MTTKRRKHRRAKRIASTTNPAPPTRIDDDETRMAASITAELTRIGQSIYRRELRKALTRARKRI